MKSSNALGKRREKPRERARQEPSQAKRQKSSQEGATQLPPRFDATGTSFPGAVMGGQLAAGPSLGTAWQQMHPQSDVSTALSSTNGWDSNGGTTANMQNNENLSSATLPMLLASQLTTMPTQDAQPLGPQLGSSVASTNSTSGMSVDLNASISFVELLTAQQNNPAFQQVLLKALAVAAVQQASQVLPPAPSFQQEMLNVLAVAGSQQTTQVLSSAPSVQQESLHALAVPDTQQPTQMLPPAPATNGTSAVSSGNNYRRSRNCPTAPQHLQAMPSSVVTPNTGGIQHNSEGSHHPDTVQAPPVLPLPTPVDADQASSLLATIAKQHAQHNVSSGYTRAQAPPAASSADNNSSRNRPSPPQHLQQAMSFTANPSNTGSVPKKSVGVSHNPAKVRTKGSARWRGPTPINPTQVASLIAVLSKQHDQLQTSSSSASAKKEAAVVSTESEESESGATSSNTACLSDGEGSAPLSSKSLAGDAEASTIKSKKVPAAAPGSAIQEGPTAAQKQELVEELMCVLQRIRNAIGK